MSNYDAESLAYALGSLFPFMTMGMFVLMWIGLFVFFTALWLVFSYPYYRMAKRAGLPYAWLAFIPVGCYYVLLNLPKREFNIFNWIVTNDRMKVFWYYLIGYGGYLALTVLSNIPILNILLLPISYIVSMAFIVAVYILFWRINYDILMTYRMEEHAMWASIVSCFVPPVMTVFSFIIMNNEPDYTI